MNKVIKVFFVNSRHDLFLFVSFIMIYPYNMKQYVFELYTRVWGSYKYVRDP